MTCSKWMNFASSQLGYGQTLAMLVLLMSTPVVASPWLEANDPFLRADLTALSDAGELKGPINHYPLRWSSFYDDTEPRKHDTAGQSALMTARDNMLTTARNHVRYRAHAAKFNRAPIEFDLYWANDPANALDYGDTPRHEWLIGSAYQYMSNRFAFKVANQYRREANGDKEYTWQGSYLALNDGRWLFTIGQIDRWWGQGWQHNLIWGNQSSSAPSASVSYLGEHLPVLGYWSLETVYQLPDKTGYDTHWAARLVSKPIRQFQHGISYQKWQDPNGERRISEQWAWDTKLALPAFDWPISHAIYTELASNYQGQELATSLVGWSGQTEIAQQSVRLVFEEQTTYDGFESSLANTPAVDQQLSSDQLGGNSTTYGLDNSRSVAVYTQFSNDHAVKLMLADREQTTHNWHEIEASYRLPVAMAMVTLGASQTDDDAPNVADANTRFWLKYQLRF
ncbi:capsule assembly Wzi family protein [Salinivibrio kushneri]|nr:capsule assembly Wzi family protein [Salinivibrio kushneri]